MGFPGKKNKAALSGGGPRLLLLVSEEKYFMSHRLSLAKEAESAGYKVVIATKLSDRNTEDGEFNLQTVHIPFERSVVNFFSELKVLYQVRQCISHTEPAVVHAVSLKMCVVAGLCLLGRKDISLLCAFTGFGHLFTSGAIKAKVIRSIAELLLKLLLRKSNYWSVVQNGDDYNLLKKIRGDDSGRTSVIRGSGVDTDLFRFSEPSQAKCRQILFPARLLGDKGLREFVSAARMIRTRRSDVKFVVAGPLDKSNPSAVESGEMFDWVSEGIVEWLGECDAMDVLYRESYLVCLPSYREGLPKSLLEAASTGRPIVATDVPGCREICRHKENGLLVPVENSIALADALVTLLDDPDLCRRLGSKGRVIVETEFSSDRINSEFLLLYHRILEVQRRPIIQL